MAVWKGGEAAAQSSSEASFVQKKERTKVKALIHVRMGVCVG